MDSDEPADRPGSRAAGSVAPIAAVGALLARIAQERGLDYHPRPEAVTEALGDLIAYVDALLEPLSDEVERQWLAAGLAALSHHVQLASRPDATPSHRTTDLGGYVEHDQAHQLRPGESEEDVALAVVTSQRGVLVGRRRSGIPRWVLPGGKIHPTEPVGPAAARECAEETGLAVVPSAVIGHRLHPVTGKHLVYVACTLQDAVDDTDDATSAHGISGIKQRTSRSDELVELRWLDLAELDRRLPDLYPPVRVHVAEALAKR